MQQIKSFLDTYFKILKQKSFATVYHRTFQLVRADTENLKEKALLLRHKVFCEEYGVECPEEQHNYREEDRYDAHAEHYILMHRVSGETVGTLRVILPDEKNPSQSLPIQEHCDHPLLRKDSRVLALCEISKFCMAPRFRKRPADGQYLSAYHEQGTVKTDDHGNIALFRRHIPYPQAALLAGAFEAALRARILDCVWMVEPDHLRSLNQIGFDYRILGPQVDYHGAAQPLIFNIKHVLDNMRHKAPHCWDIISDQGRLQKIADKLNQNDWQDRLIDEDCWNEICKKLTF